LDGRDREHDRSIHDADYSVCVDAISGSCDGCDGAVHLFEECELDGLSRIVSVR
jgi:hypothetical protein